LAQLPVELILLIFEHLTAEGKAALALTCHFMLSIAGEDVFTGLKHFVYTGYGARCAKSFFLRSLERDRRDPSVYVCYKCLKFHGLEEFEGGPLRIKPARGVGFPVCRTPYMEALRHVHSLHNCTKSDVELKSWAGTTISPVHMSYYVESGLSGDDVFLVRKFTLKTNRGHYDQHFMMPSSFLLTSNLEICPHVFFGWDCRLGISGVYEALDEYYHRQHRDWTLASSRGHAWQPEPFTGFMCHACNLEIDIRFRPREVRIVVWNHVCALKKEEVSWPRKIKNVLKKPRDFEERVKKNGGLKAGDLEQEWENIPYMSKGSYVCGGRAQQPIAGLNLFKAQSYHDIEARRLSRSRSTTTPT
jgi:hypothetical protein